MGLVNVHISNKVVASAAKGGAQRSRPPRPRVTRPNEQAAFVYLAKGWWPKDDDEHTSFLGSNSGLPPCLASCGRCWIKVSNLACVNYSVAFVMLGWNEMVFCCLGYCCFAF